ncbi:DNA topoisomerase 1 [Tetrabaena socialis]|uniref:DNA topoisomerase 1 n=1 Tax=Tetrabaena socialis TaxID=47790 RepID=A0A2J7ZL32_9CHLO|nr:DNA topoisomerase 1 [Tetrabaena socialis]|eukprot:PNH00960.1 DNA topoisomerase 1 [Tetrabaena socialis]
MYRRHLSHDGASFPPVFNPLGTKLICDGKEVPLSPDAEEIALSWARYRKRPMSDAVRQRATRNFWADFQKLLRSKIATKEADCDFEAILSQGVVKKKSKPKPKLKLKHKQSYANVDGERIPVGNTNVGVPGVFMGRGVHNKYTGKVRRRVYPEDVTLNLSKDAPIPESPVEGHSWGGIIADKGAMWLARWKDPVTHIMKYVYLAPNAEPAWQKTMEKFEVVRKLQPAFGEVVKRNERNLHAKNKRMRQLSTCAALIFELAIRVGKRTSTHVFGAATLLVRHIKVQIDGKVDLNFIGKDSVPYSRVGWVPLATRISKNLRDLLKGKQANDRVFDAISPHSVNEYVSTLNPALTCKVIRTFRANQEFEGKLVVAPRDDPRTVHKNALLHVAEFCNHRSGPKLSVNTSLANYLDPRLTFRFAREHGVKPKDLMPEALLAKFDWAKDIP